MKKLYFILALTYASIMMAQPGQDLYKDALKMLEDGHVAYKIDSKISAAIELDSLNLEYRWVRVRNNLKSNAQESALEQAVKDLEFIIANGGGTANVFGNLGLAHQELDLLYKYRKPKESNSFKDDDNSEAMKTYYKFLFENATKSLNAYKKAIEIKPEAEANLNSRLQTMKQKIVEYEKKITEL